MWFRVQYNEITECCNDPAKLLQYLFSLPSFFEINMDIRTRGHSFKLVKHRCHLEMRRHFFSERVINRWNKLDQATVSATTVNSFKSRLEKEEDRRSACLWTISLLGLEAVLHHWSGRTCELPVSFIAHETTPLLHRVLSNLLHIIQN